MRDPKRIEKVLDLIRKIWGSNPNFRLMQLLNNIIPEQAKDITGTYFYLEDEDLECYLRKYIESMKIGE